MQLANPVVGDPILRGHVRRATREDAAVVQRLLRMGVYVHVHVDWRLPGEWLGHSGFVIFDRGMTGVEGQAKGKPDVIGCLAVAADPGPAAWVRAAAVETSADFAHTHAMFTRVLDDLDPAIDEIAWFLTDYWPLHWLERLEFVPVNEVLAFRKDDLEAPPYSSPAGLEIRPLLMEDIPVLAAIETAAFEARWRHSAADLAMAWRHSISFEVALLDGVPVGFQLSTGGDGNAHLSRMTVHPDRQGMGIGAALLAGALKSYRSQRIKTVTLNTQSDNLASRKLYERFGFKPLGYSYPVWSYFPSRPQPDSIP